MAWVRADPQTEAALEEILERFCSGFAARDADAVMQLFAPDADVGMVTSEKPFSADPTRQRPFSAGTPGELPRTPGVGTAATRSAAGAVGWLLAEGTETAATGNREEKHPYRMSMVCEKRAGRWLLIQVHGSSPNSG